MIHIPRGGGANCLCGCVGECWGRAASDWSAVGAIFTDVGRGALAGTLTGTLTGTRGGIIAGTLTGTRDGIAQRLSLRLGC